ncbi:MAG: spore germination protein [Pilosibacter sp.]
MDALTMNQESLAECIFPHKWFNPFPKFRFSERPDTAAASILEGNIVHPCGQLPRLHDPAVPQSSTSSRRRMTTTSRR